MPLAPQTSPVIEIGCHLVLDLHATYGFDVEQTLPCRYWFTQKLHDLDPALLLALFHTTVAALQEELPRLGETVAFDVKYIYAWVKEHNLRVYVTDRYDKEQILKSDLDCKLGVICPAAKSVQQRDQRISSGQFQFISAPI